MCQTQVRDYSSRSSSSSSSKVVVLLTCFLVAVVLTMGISQCLEMKKIKKYINEIVKGELKPHIHISLYESSTLQV